MSRRNITSGSAFEKPIGFSRAVRIGNMISVSGTASIAADGTTLYPNDLYNQTRTCIEIMKKAILEAGGRMEDVIRTRVYLTNMAIWEQAAKAHGEYFSEIRPASTFVEVKGFIGKNWLVEMEADCVVKT